MQDYEKHLHRAWEVNTYNDLGFIILGQLEETNRGWKNESREPTSSEQHMWEMISEKTPEVPIVQIDDSVDLWEVSITELNFEEYGKQSADGKAIWLENSRYKFLYGKSGYPLDWTSVYKHIK